MYILDFEKIVFLFIPENNLIELFLLLRPSTKDSNNRLKNKRFKTFIGTPK